MDNNYFQKHSTIWRYFSGNSYHMRLLEDYGFLDAEDYKLFCLLVQEKRENSKKNPLIMDEKDFHSETFSLLEKPSLLELLEKMILPLRMKYFELNLADEESCSEKSISFKKLASELQNQSFQNDIYNRWQMYFDTTLKTIKDLQIPYPEVLKQLNPSAADEREKINLQRAKILQNELKKALSGVGEYFIQKEVIWSVREKNLTRLFLDCSRTFDIKDINLTPVQLLDKEEIALGALEKAIVWAQTNDKGRIDAFDSVLSARDFIQKRRENLEIEQFKKIIVSSFNLKQKKDDAKERE